jgi:hypothetical protein
MLGANELLSAIPATARVVARSEAADVVIGGTEPNLGPCQPSKLMHELALFLMEAKRIAVAWREPRQPVGQRVKV